LTITILTSVAELIIQTGQPEHGLELLHIAHAYPAGNHETHRQAAKIIARYQNQSPGRGNSSARRTANLEEVVKEVLAELTALPVDPRKEPANPRDDGAVEKSLAGLVTVTGKQALVDPLTNREIEILRCMNDGLSNQSIAGQLFISLGTVKWYTSQIYAKLQVSSRTQAVAKAREMGIL